jgi:hypothetical protein
MWQLSKNTRRAFPPLLIEECPAGIFLVGFDGAKVGVSFPDTLGQIAHFLGLLTHGAANGGVVLLILFVLEVM